VVSGKQGVVGEASEPEVIECPCFLDKKTAGSFSTTGVYYQATKQKYRKLFFSSRATTVREWLILLPLQNILHCFPHIFLRPQIPRAPMSRPGRNFCPQQP
jgi:hypothetical protein